MGSWPGQIVREVCWLTTAPGRARSPVLFVATDECRTVPSTHLIAVELAAFAGRSMATRWIDRPSVRLRLDWGSRCIANVHRYRDGRTVEVGMSSPVLLVPIRPATLVALKAMRTESDGFQTSRQRSDEFTTSIFSRLILAACGITTET